MVLGKLLRMPSMLNPSVCSLKLAATSAILRPIFHATKNAGRVILEEYFMGDILYREVLTFVSCELYMLPERELAKSRSDFD